MYRYESWTRKKAEHQRIDAFELWCWRRLLRVPWTAQRSNQSILKEISAEYSLEGLMLKLKLQYFGHLVKRTDSLKKTLLWERLKAGGEGDWRTDDGMVAWHNQLNGHKFEYAPGIDDGQGSLVCCSPWGHKEWDTTEWLNWRIRKTNNVQEIKISWNIEYVHIHFHFTFVHHKLNYHIQK